VPQQRPLDSESGATHSVARSHEYLNTPKNTGPYSPGSCPAAPSAVRTAAMQGCHHGTNTQGSQRMAPGDSFSLSAHVNLKLRLARCAQHPPGPAAAEKGPSGRPAQAATDSAPGRLPGAPQCPRAPLALASLSFELYVTGSAHRQPLVPAKSRMIPGCQLEPRPRPCPCSKGAGLWGARDFSAP
jgi:hypothetical protein